MSFDVSSDGNMLAAGTDLKYDDASIFYWLVVQMMTRFHALLATHVL